MRTAFETEFGETSSSSRGLRLAMMIAALALTVTGVASAQRATQVVRFKIVPNTSGTITNGTTTSGAGKRTSATPGASEDQFGPGVANPVSSATPPTTATTSSGTAASPSRAVPAAASAADAAAATDTRAADLAKIVSAAGLPKLTPVVVTPVWSATLTVRNTDENKKVAVSLESPMPEGVGLTLEMKAGSGSQSAGVVGLQTEGVDAVSAIPSGASTALPLSFAIAESAYAAPSPPVSRKVNFTLITGA